MSYECWVDEEPSVFCGRCGTQHEIVRPGKTQPTCDCDDFCYAHDEPVKIEYRPSPMTDWQKGGIFGYVCPTCFPA